FHPAEISLRTGTLAAIENRLSGERHVLERDAVGIKVAGENEWIASRDATPQRRFVMTSNVAKDGSGASVVLEEGGVWIVYSLGARDFWLRRHVEVERGGRYTI